MGLSRNFESVEAVLKTEALVPAVPIWKSITPGFLVCLDVGKRLKTLKGHLTNFGMTPDQYRTKWGLLLTTIRWSHPNMQLLRGRRLRRKVELGHNREGR